MHTSETERTTELLQRLEVDARAAAETYLREKAKSLGGEPAALLDRAATLYARQNAFLTGILNAKDAFLGPWTRKKFEDWTEEVRQRERGSIEAMSTQEAEAVGVLEKALSSMESAKQDEGNPHE